MGWGFLAMAVGLVLVVVPLGMGVNAWKRRRTWHRVDGTVISVRERKDPSSSGSGNANSTTTVVKYRFADPKGKYYTGTDTPVLRKPRRGGQLVVRYDPDAPDSNEPASDFPGMMVLAAVLPVVGAGLVVWGFVLMVGV